VNAGNAPYVAAHELTKVSKAIGPVSSTQAAVQPETLNGRDFKAMKQGYAMTFALYAISNAVAAEYECDPNRAYEMQAKARTAKDEKNKGSYYASALRLKSVKGKSDAVTLVWTKEGKYWKVVSWEVEPPEGKPGTTRDTRRAAVAAARPPKMKGDPGVVQATHDFLHTWLVNDDYQKASAYLSQSCDACVSLYLGEGEKAPTNEAEYSAYIRETLNKVAKKVGKVQHLREAMEPVAPGHEDLREVEHAGEHAYTLVAVPDELEASFLCKKRSSKEPYAPDESADKHYGKYYATMLTFKTPGEHPAALTLSWGKENEQWKIISYEVVTP
jgi:hypothetical protein